VRLVAAIALVSSVTSSALACPLDEGATTLHPGGRTAFSGEVLPLPSQPSLYYVAHEGADVRIEAESHGKPVPFTLVDISPHDDATTMRIDLAIDSGPLVVRTLGYRSLTYSYRVEPGYTPSHAATISSSTSQNTWSEYLDIESEAAIYRVERESVYPHVIDERNMYGYISAYSSRFRVTGLYADRSTAVLYDPPEALVGVTRDTARFATAWLPTFERQPVPPVAPTWPRWLALALLLAAHFAASRRRP
jgi:hypothetical protein